MTDQPLRGPSEAEQLAAEFPHAEIYREVLEDGRHGGWIAELRLQLRAATPQGLRRLLVQADQLRRRVPAEGNAD